MNLIDMAKQLQSDIRQDWEEQAARIEAGEDAHKVAAENFQLTPPQDSDMVGRIMTAEAAMKFITAGNAYFTLRSAKTGTRFTYRVSRSKCSRCGAKDCNCWANPLLFVKVLTGPENTSDYQYLAYIKDKSYVHGGAKARIGRNAPSAVAFEWAFNALTAGHLPVNLEIFHDGRCGRCGRKLTVPESVESGIGPECRAMMGL